MGYLSLEDGVEDFTEAVISFWFRAPAESLDALKTRAASDYEAETPPPMVGVMPLMTFGKIFEGQGFDVSFPTDGTYTSTYWQFNGPFSGDTGWTASPPISYPYGTGPVYSPGKTFPVDPCYVGIYFDPAQTDPIPPYLRVFLQTGDKGSASWLSYKATHSAGNQNWGYVVGTTVIQNGASAWNGTACETNSTAPGNPLVDTTTYEEASEIVMPEPDSFLAGSPAMEIKPDHWHHVLISFKLVAGGATGGYAVHDGTACAAPTFTRTSEPEVKSPSQLWIALDDKNYTGKDLRGEVSGYIPYYKLTLDKNDIISHYMNFASQSSQGELHYRTWVAPGAIADMTISGAGTPSYDYPANPLPTSGQPFGIPAANNMADKILRVEMAEFQMWIGKSVDTGLVDTRRAFITKEGKPVLDYTIAEQLLGREPDLRLHKSPNWKKGKNTGVDIQTDPVTGIPITVPSATDFKPTGDIEAYKPNPSLHGPQSPEDLKS